MYADAYILQCEFIHFLVAWLSGCLGFLLTSIIFRFRLREPCIWLSCFLVGCFAAIASLVLADVLQWGW